MSNNLWPIDIILCKARRSARWIRCLWIMKASTQTEVVGANIQLYMRMEILWVVLSGLLGVLLCNETEGMQGVWRGAWCRAEAAVEAVCRELWRRWCLWAEAVESCNKDRDLGIQGAQWYFSHVWFTRPPSLHPPAHCMGQKTFPSSLTAPLSPDLPYRAYSQYPRGPGPEASSYSTWPEVRGSSSSPP